MYKYILKRLIMIIPVLFGIIFIVFMLLSFTPGDPAQIILGSDATDEGIKAIREELGLNDPKLIQLFRYIFDLARGDMGYSYRNSVSVASQIALKLPNTLILSVASIIIAIFIGIPIGIISAIKKYTSFDNISMISSLFLTSTPTFWMGLVFVIIFSLKLGWFPSSGMGEGFGGVLKSLVLPAVTIGAGSAGAFARITRSSMLDVMREDYVSTARAKGISEFKVIKDHMLKNALIPIVTVIGFSFGQLLGGAVIVETVFAWPGVGKYLIDAVRQRDMPVILGCVVVFSMLFSLVNLFVDILYAFIDPRIKSQYRK